MEKSKSKLLYLLISIAILLNVFFIPNMFHKYDNTINLSIWTIIFVLAISIKNTNIHIKYIKEKIKIVVIIIIIYYMIYFLFGLVFEYSKSPYSHTVKGIILNILLLSAVLAMQEYVRTKLVAGTKNKYMYFFIAILFVMLKLKYHYIFTNFINPASTFKYSLNVIFIEILNSLLLTYLSISGGYLLNYAYCLSLHFITILLPIFPSFNWFIDILLKSVLIFIIYIFINYENTIEERKYSKLELKRLAPYKILPTLIVLLLCICFIAGIFSYKPVAILSNSMYPTFSRGYLLIIKNIKNQDKKDIKENEIIAYELNHRIIIHRIIYKYINLNGEAIYITKGDNNMNADLKEVSENQIAGLVKYEIPYIGYPAVWMSENIFYMDLKT